MLSLIGLLVRDAVVPCLFSFGVVAKIPSFERAQTPKENSLTYFFSAFEVVF